MIIVINCKCEDSIFIFMILNKINNKTDITFKWLICTQVVYATIKFPKHQTSTWNAERFYVHKASGVIQNICTTLKSAHEVNFLSHISNCIHIIIRNSTKRVFEMSNSNSEMKWRFIFSICNIFCSLWNSPISKKFGSNHYLNKQFLI